MAAYDESRGASEQLRRMSVHRRAAERTTHTLLSLRQVLRQLSASQRKADQVMRELRHELQRWRGEPAMLQGMAAPELERVVGALEGSLSRVRAAHTQALAVELSASFKKSEEELLCPVCLDARKDMVFQCGHQTCAACSLLVRNCPICRARIAQRIRVF